MFRLKRILLIAPAEMTRTPAFDRAQALARASGALLHIVAFDHVQSLALAESVELVRGNDHIIMRMPRAIATAPLQIAPV